MLKEKKDIRTTTDADLGAFLESIGEPKFRLKQINQWLWQKGAGNFMDMTNLSAGLREQLINNFNIFPIKENIRQTSADGTIKVGFGLHDGQMVEGVLIPTESRVTACISSQVGCSLNCKFCATGYLKMQRNLDAGEIFDQVNMLNRISKENYKSEITNIVFMGMGEPLLNYKNVTKAIEILTSPEGLGMSSKRITLSTVGIAKMIRKLADERIKINLAISLHAPTDIKRSAIMPVNLQINLESLLTDLTYYAEKTKRQITFEYTLLKGVNDSVDDAKDLVKLCAFFPVKVNLIEYNPIKEADYRPTDNVTLNTFIKTLAEKNVTVSVRRSRGKDIDAACGQLANKLI